MTTANRWWEIVLDSPAFWTAIVCLTAVGVAVGVAFVPEVYTARLLAYEGHDNPVIRAKVDIAGLAIIPLMVFAAVVQLSLICLAFYRKSRV